MKSFLVVLSALFLATSAAAQNPGGVGANGTNTWITDQYFKSGRPWIDLMAFTGADPTNTSDSTAALQAAITAATSGSGAQIPFTACKDIYVPPGEYKIASPQAIHLKGGLSFCKMFGAGPDNSVLNFTYDTAPLASTALSQSGSVDTITMVSNPITAGYAVGQLANLTGYTPASLNDYCSITAVTSTTVTCTANVGSGAGAASVQGTVNIGYEVVEDEAHGDGQLLGYTIEDIGFAGPGGAGSHNLSFLIFSESGATSPPSMYRFQVRGFQTGWEVGPNWNTGGGGFGALVEPHVRDVNTVFHVINGQATPNAIYFSDICTSTTAGAAIWLIDGQGAVAWNVSGGFPCTQSTTGSIVKLAASYNGGIPAVWLGTDLHFELLGGGSTTAQLFDGSAANLSAQHWECYGCNVVNQGAANRSIVNLKDNHYFLWEGGNFGNSAVTMTSDTNANNPGNPGFNAPEFTIENASWPGVATCTAAANITTSSPAAANNPIYRIRNVSCKNTSPFMFPDSDFGFPGQSTVSNHDFKARRYFSNQGTGVANGDISITGWGTGAAVSSAAGFDQAFTFTITAGTSPSANPTFSLTYKDGTWTNIPISLCKMVAGTGALTTLSGEQAGSATVLGPVVFNGTPVNTNTYIINCVSVGK